MSIVSTFVQNNVDSESPCAPRVSAILSTCRRVDVDLNNSFFGQIGVIFSEQYRKGKLLNPLSCNDFTD